MKQPVFEGSCTAIITPFSPEGLDLKQMGKLLDFQTEQGTKAIVAAGTTGENATLDDTEFDALIEFCVQHNAGRMKMIAGIGGNDTKKCLHKAKLAKHLGVDALLMTTPYYNKTTQAGLIEHFRYVADRVDLPIILYNVPSRTSIGISAETYRTLASHPNINGVKEASGDFSLIARMKSECGEELNLWSGNDDQTLPMMALGAKGVISVASNLIPEVIAKLCALCLAGQFSDAAALYAEYAELCRLLFSETNPIPVKTAMSILGLDSGLLRLPLVPMSEGNRTALKHCLNHLHLFPKES